MSPSTDPYAPGGRLAFAAEHRRRRWRYLSRDSAPVDTKRFLPMFRVMCQNKAERDPVFALSWRGVAESIDISVDRAGAIIKLAMATGIIEQVTRPVRGIEPGTYRMGRAA